MPTEEEIQELVLRAQQGDNDGVAELFRMFSDRIFRFLRLRVGSSEVAEDLTQTVFLEMVQSVPRYKRQSTAKFSTWLFQIARFRLIDYYRKTHYEVPIDDILSTSHPALAIDPKEDVDLGTVDAALAQLPERYKIVIHLRFREDMAVGDIAKVMQTSSVNVRVIQHRAISALRKLLEGKE